jgi:hypothetical protein
MERDMNQRYGTIQLAKAGKTMRYLALATDLDGTLAHDGVVDESTLGALRRVRASGRRLVLVTGRELDNLLATFPHCDLFDRVVAENGALLYRPAEKTLRTLAGMPPQPLIEDLKGRGVPISVGRCIVSTSAIHEPVLLAAIRDLELEWHLIFNMGGVMALPAHITKATGLALALAELQVTAEQTVAVGDAENDHAFLQICGIRVAVANALPSLKAMADVVTRRAEGAGVTELIDTMLLAKDMSGVDPSRR